MSTQDVDSSYYDRCKPHAVGNSLTASCGHHYSVTDDQMRQAAADGSAMQSNQCACYVRANKLSIFM